jgi:hypothetical protein
MLIWMHRCKANTWGVTGPSPERSSLVLLDDDRAGQGDVTTSCLWSMDMQRRGGGAIVESAMWERGCDDGVQDGAEC